MHVVDIGLTFILYLKQNLNLILKDLFKLKRKLSTIKFI